MQLPNNYEFLKSLNERLPQKKMLFLFQNNKQLHRKTVNEMTYID